MGAEEGIGGSFRRDLKGFDQFGGGCGRVILAVDASECAPGLRFGGGARVAGIEF